jgi:hypothetical protein
MTHGGFFSGRHPGFRIAVLVPMLALGGLATAFAAKPPRCSDVPITLTFVPTGVVAAPAAIWNDDPMKVYQDGVDGVGAVIHTCSGTGDVTLGLKRSMRSLMIQFPSAIPGSIIDGGPVSFDPNPFATQAFVNIRNIVGYGLPSGTTTYYTRVVFSFDGPDGATYKLAFFPHDEHCPVPGLCAAALNEQVDPDAVNQPVETAWAKVTYTPASGSSPDTWVVDGTLTDNEPGPVVYYERGTIFKITNKSGSFGPHYGQYSMPFKILVTALAPLPQ